MIDFGSDQEFISNYEKLKSAQKMSQIYHCSKSSVLNHAKKIGYDNSKNKELKVTAFPIEQIYQDYLELGSCVAVGKKYNCSSTAVLNYLKKNNCVLLDRSKIKEFSEEDFKNLYFELKSARKVGKVLRCSSTTILKYADQIGFDVSQVQNYQLSQEDKEYIKQNYLVKKSTELAEELGVSRGLITKVWFDNNLINKPCSDIKLSTIDLNGQKFGEWTVLYESPHRDRGGNVHWHCRCSCGVERDVNSASLRNGLSKSCGQHGTASRGNEKIATLLQEANILFEREKKFSSCKDKKELPFDFFVNNSYLIEYDGIQHFDPNSLYGYEDTHRHDLMKNDWCLKHHIPLIRIPYTHFDDLVLNDLLLSESSFIYNADVKSGKIGES